MRLAIMEGRTVRFGRQLEAHLRSTGGKASRRGDYPSRVFEGKAERVLGRKMFPTGEGAYVKMCYCEHGLFRTRSINMGGRGENGEGKGQVVNCLT